MKLTDLIMTDTQIDAIFGAGSAAHLRLKTLHAVTDEGRAARAARIPIQKCPPFVDNDMSISWRLGWYDEDMRRDPKGFAIREAIYLKTGLLPHEWAT